VDRKFNLDSSGNTESIIDLELLNINNVIDINLFAKNYKISNFFKGKFFIKRLINKVFKYKLEKSIKWNDYFWGKVEIVNYKASICFSKKINSLDEFENELNKSFTLKRIKKISDIKKMLNKNVKLDFPLFISGDCLNILGGNTSNNSLYMLDGSRRCLAYVLNDINEINIYLMTLKHNK